MASLGLGGEDLELGRDVSGRGRFTAGVARLRRRPRSPACEPDRKKCLSGEAPYCSCAGGEA